MIQLSHVVEQYSTLFEIAGDCWELLTSFLDSRIYLLADIMHFELL